MLCITSNANNNNKYGGFVRHLNNIMTDLGAVFVNFSEEPLIFKVMYPELLNERKIHLSSLVLTS